jgi:hypothetical protein
VSCSARTLQALVGLRPVDNPEPVRSVIWLDSAGRSAGGRAVALPARDG